jgi:predicted polyphosphate/ATP-dependent NAD kinase
MWDLRLSSQGATVVQKFLRRDNTRYGKRHKPGVMNKTEEAYAEGLQARKLSGEIISWSFEAMTFKIAADCRYTPDFAIWLADGSMELVDCKGSGPMDEKSRVKAKVAAEAFPQFIFVIEQKQTLKNGGGWKREVF